MDLVIVLKAKCTDSHCEALEKTGISASVLAAFPVQPSARCQAGPAVFVHSEWKQVTLSSLVTGTLQDRGESKLCLSRGEGQGGRERKQPGMLGPRSEGEEFQS